MWRPRFDLSVGKIPWRRKWHPTPVFLPGESHGGRSLVGYSPWGHKESDMTERFHFTSGLDWVRRHSVTRHVSLTQLCPTLCNSINGSSLGPPVYGILQAKILGVICHVFLQGIFLTRDWTWVSCITGRFFTHWDFKRNCQVLNWSFESTSIKDIFVSCTAKKKLCELQSRIWFNYLPIHMFSKNFTWIWNTKTHMVIIKYQNLTMKHHWKVQIELQMFNVHEKLTL